MQQGWQLGRTGHGQRRWRMWLGLTAVARTVEILGAAWDGGVQRAGTTAWWQRACLQQMRAED
jgi:hypothetical protein